ncbi:MAG TPA: winged helix-turn-helix transcriptional regulator [Pyrodictiaceae archaeon]|nr:winged helix-turn-helix transcriptional regulator [Pyrodictiaceae archaeon]
MTLDIVAVGVLLSLVVGLGTLGTVLLVRGWVERLRGEQERAIAELRERLSKLEAETAYLRDLLEERGSRLKLLGDRLEELRSELEEARERLRALEDLALARLEEKPKKRESGETSGQDLERDLLDLKILALYRQGYSIREIAKMVGLSKSTVHRRLKKLLGK